MIVQKDVLSSESPLNQCGKVPSLSSFIFPVYLVVLVYINRKCMCLLAEGAHRLCLMFNMHTKPFNQDGKHSNSQIETTDSNRSHRGK